MGKAPWGWWGVMMVKRLKAINNLRSRMDFGKVFDDEGTVR